MTANRGGRGLEPRPPTRARQESGEFVDFTDSTDRTMIFINLTSLTSSDLATRRFSWLATPSLSILTGTVDTFYIRSGSIPD